MKSPLESKTWTRLFPQSVTYTRPPSSTITTIAEMNSPGSLPREPHDASHSPSEVNTWTRLFPLSAT